MTPYVLNYSGPRATPSAAFPTRKSTPRPYLALNLINGNNTFKCYGLIDYGADDCIFPSSFAPTLGLQHLTGRHYPYGGAGDGKQDAYFFDLQMEIIGVTQLSLPIGFSTAMDRWGHGVLGQNGFFDQVPVSFDLRQGKFCLYLP